MRVNARVLVAVTFLVAVCPVVAAGQGKGISVTAHGAAGSHIGDGGNSQSLGLGIWFGEHLGVVLNAERSHVPSEVTFFEDGYSTRRGGKTRFITAEFRFAPITYKRVSPYLIVASGRGISRPDVNEFFPRPVTHKVMLQGPGVGVRVAVTDHLSAFSDVRFLFQSRRGEPDAGAIGPIRGGLSWRF